MPTAPPAALTTASLNTSIVAAVRYEVGGRPRFEQAVEHLGRLYRPVLGGASVVGTWDPAASCGLVAVGAEIGSGGVCWGRPLAPEGVPSDEPVRRVLEDPVSGRDLWGFWMVAGWVDDGLRLVTTAEPVSTLRRVEGRGSVAWATRGLAAHALAGVRPQIDDRLIPELVLFDFVFGDRELLEATRLEDRAVVVDLGRGGSRTSSYWPLVDRFAPGPATSARELRDAVVEVAGRSLTAPDVVLGLTAGRDSTLFASCLAEVGGPVETYTMGDPSWPDVVGAGAVAGALGWPHRVLAPPDPSTTPPPSLERAIGWSVWGEGMVLGRDLVGEGLADLDGDRHLLLTGLGGEAGRALYWQGADQPLVEQLLVHRDLCQGAPRAFLRDRVEEALDRCAGSGRRGQDLLDVFYVEERMRHWLLRSRPVAWVDGVVAAYLAPDVLRTLLDLPAEDRRTGRAFDEALALGPLPLRAIAQAALSPVSPPARTWRQRFRLPRSAGPTEAPAVVGLLDELDGGPARCTAALGPGVVEGLRHDAPRQAGAQYRLWTVLAVEALDRALARMEWPSPP